MKEESEGIVMRKMREDLGWIELNWSGVEWIERGNVKVEEEQSKEKESLEQERQCFIFFC